MPDASPGPNWEFDGFAVLRDMRLLLSDGVAVPLTGKAFDTLAILVANRERVVTKDELLRAVWPDVVVEEGNLTQQIFLLRRALGESAQQPRYIVTVPGHGYRFTAAVRTISTESASASRDTAIPRIATYLSVGVVAVLAIVLALAWRTSTSVTPATDFDRWRIGKVTESGKATDSAMSRDGRQVAYVETDGDEYSVWVKQIAGGGTTQIVSPEPAVLTHLTFSPDGESVYFARGLRTSGRFVLSRIPAAGGVETPILDDVDTPVSFSPDGREFAFTRGTEDGAHIVVAAAGGGSQRILAARQKPLSFELVAPSWSPDGQTVAVSAVDYRSSRPRWSILLLPVSGGAGRDLYSTDDRIGRIRWRPDGSGLLTVVSQALTRQFPPWHSNQFVRFSGGPIWRVGYPDGRAERLTSDLTDHDLCCLDVSATGTKVAAVMNSLVSDLWIAPAASPSSQTQITWSNPIVARHSWLPDNDTVVYRDLSGNLNAVHKDGRTFSLSLPTGQRVSGGVSTCGDGRYVVYQAAGGGGIWRTPANAGGAVRLTGGSSDSNPACSPDGKWVMFSSVRERVASLWRVSIDGGQPTPLIEGESYDALPSPRGRLIYYSTSHWSERPVPTRSTRWIVASLGDLKQVLSMAAPEDASFGVPPVWAPDDSGLDYVVTRNGVSNIWRQPLTGGRPVQITRFSVGRVFSFAWSPNGRWLSLGSGVNRSDVVLMSSER